MSVNNLPKGKLGEDIASNYLRNKGYRIIQRNFKARYGEIDIIATFKNTLIFVEVKTRWGTPFGTPQEAVTKWKLEAVVRAAQYFKLTYPSLPESMQIDVVSVQLDHSGILKSIEHLESVTS